MGDEDDSDDLEPTESFSRIWSVSGDQGKPGIATTEPHILQRQRIEDIKRTIADFNRLLANTNAAAIDRSQATQITKTAAAYDELRQLKWQTEFALGLETNELAKKLEHDLIRQYRKFRRAVYKLESRAPVESASKPDAKTTDWTDPAFWKARSAEEAEAAVHVLVAQNKDVTMTAHTSGDTALHQVARFYGGSAGSITRIVRTLVESNAHVDAQDKQGRTPLLVATAQNEGTPEIILELVRALVEFKTDVSAKDASGNTAYSLVQGRSRQYWPVAALLAVLECNSDTPNESQSQGNAAVACPPALAALLNHEECKRNEALHAALRRLRDDAVGLDFIKDAIASVVSMRLFGGGMKFNNFALLGATGTGKSHIARLIGEVLIAVQSLDAPDKAQRRRQPQYVHVHESDLVAGYVGQTAGKVVDFLNAHKGDVLFFDEANKLVSDTTSGAEFGAKAVSSWMSWLEENPGVDHNGRTRAAETATCIVAGYPADLQRYFFRDRGFAARFDILPELPPLQPKTLWQICLAKLRRWREQVPLPGPTVLQAIESAVTLAAQKGLFTPDKLQDVAAMFANAHGTGDKLPEFAQRVHFRRLIRNGCQAGNHSYAWCYADFYDALVAMAESGQHQRKDYSRIKAELERDLPPVEPGVDDVCGIGAEAEMQIDAGVRYQGLLHTTQHSYQRTGVFDTTCHHCGRKNAFECRKWNTQLSECCRRENIARLEKCIRRAGALLSLPVVTDDMVAQYAMTTLLQLANGMLADELVDATSRSKLADAVKWLRKVVDRRAHSHVGRTGPDAGGVGAVEVHNKPELNNGQDVTAPDISRATTGEITDMESHENSEPFFPATVAARKGARNAEAQAAQNETAVMSEEGGTMRATQQLVLEKEAATREQATALHDIAVAMREKQEAEQARVVATREKEAALHDKEVALREKDEAMQEKEAAVRAYEAAVRDNEELRKAMESAEWGQKQKEAALRQQDASETLLATIRQRTETVIVVAKRALAAAVGVWLSVIPVTTFGQPFWPTIPIVLGALAGFVLVCSVSSSCCGCGVSYHCWCYVDRVVCSPKYDVAIVPPLHEVLRYRCVQSAEYGCCTVMKRLRLRVPHLLTGRVASTGWPAMILLLTIPAVLMLYSINRALSSPFECLCIMCTWFGACAQM